MSSIKIKKRKRKKKSKYIKKLWSHMHLAIPLCTTREH